MAYLCAARRDKQSCLLLTYIYRARKKAVAAPLRKLGLSGRVRCGSVTQPTTAKGRKNARVGGVGVESAAEQRGAITRLRRGSPIPVTRGSPRPVNSPGPPRFGAPPPKHTDPELGSGLLAVLAWPFGAALRGTSGPRQKGAAARGSSAQTQRSRFNRLHRLRGRCRGGLG